MNSKVTSVDHSVKTVFIAVDPFDPVFHKHFDTDEERKEFLIEHPDAECYEEYVHQIHVYVHPSNHVESELCKRIHNWAANTFAPGKEHNFYSISGTYHYNYGNMEFIEDDCTYITINVRTKDFGKSFCMNGLVKILLEFGEIEF